jgi:predicted acylesterase/phospholipase RssA
MPEVPKSREARLGIVMYGGVSLAIYINGVGQELFRAVKGTGIYKLLKTCLDTDIVVDIVSGTSAGGINGLFLAYALLNGKDFNCIKNLWREHGDFSRLLQDVNLDPENCKSLLNSDEYYRAHMKGAFEDLDAHPFDATGCAPSHVKEMDVFITGTSFYPDTYTTFDDAGRPIDMLEYRKIFRLKHRTGRAYAGPFTATGGQCEVLHQALAKLARVTSSFPAAFQPVRVLVAKDWVGKNPRQELPFIYAREPEVDKLLCEWGALTESAYFLDGGVLANKPFTPTIDAIFSRAANRPVDRILFYVEPDPESAGDGQFCEPTFLSSIISGTVGIGTYQSTTDDAKLVEEHNTEVIRHNAVCDEIRGKLGKPETLGTGVTIPASLAEPQRSLYLNARTIQLASRALRGALRDSETGAEPHLTSAADRERVKQLFASLKDRQPGDLDPNQMFARFDIYFRLRRLEHTVKRIYTLLFETTPPPDDPNRQLLRGLNRHIELLEIVRFWIEYAVDRAPVIWKNNVPRPWDYVWRQMMVFLETALRYNPAEDAPWLPPLDGPMETYLSTPSLDAFHKALGLRVKGALDDFKGGIPVRPPQEQFRGLLQWTDEAEAAFWQRCQNSSPLFVKFRDEYTQFVNLDAVLFPPDFLTNLHDFNEVRLMRIGPSPSLDGSGGGLGFWAVRGADDKLAGRSLAHFSGFLKRSWRSNDILWGRLDGLRHILIPLLSADRVAQLRADEPLKQKIRDNLAAAGGLEALLAEVFPNSPQASQKQLFDFFNLLLAAGGAAIDPDTLCKNLNLLIEMGQLQVLYEELGDVMRDAAKQQAQWNHYERPPKPGKKPTPGANFLSPIGYTDPSLIGLHAESEITNLMTAWKAGASTAPDPKRTPIGQYFEGSYDIASEGLKGGLPPLIAASYATQSALVANNCILGSIPKPMRDNITGNAIYSWGVRRPLRFSYALIGMWIRAPKTLAITSTFAVAAALVALLIDYFWRGDLFAWSHFSVLTVVVLLGVPLALLFLAYKVLWGLMKKTDY